MVGYDINYLLQIGVLVVFGYVDWFLMLLLNLVVDFGGGLMLVLLGIVVVFYEWECLGVGQVVDVVMVDGVSVLVQMMWIMKGIGSLCDQCEFFLFDGGVLFYCCYEMFDGKYMVVGVIELQFFVVLLSGFGLLVVDVLIQFDVVGYLQMYDIFVE